MSSRKNRTYNTQLVDPTTINPDNIIFDEVEECTVPGQTMKYYRVNIGYKNSNGTEGDLVLGFERLPSTGIKENRDENTGVLTGYSVGIALRDREGASRRQKAGIDAINTVVQKVKEHVLTIKAKVKKPTLTMQSYGNVSPVWQKYNDDGTLDETSTPMMYPKLIYSKPKTDKNGNELPEKIYSTFYSEVDVDNKGNPLKVDPMDYLAGPNRKFFVTPAVKMESIFINATAVKLQIKLLEADIHMEESGPRRLLRRFASSMDTPSVNVDGSNPLFSKPDSDNEEEEDETSDKEDTPVTTSTSNDLVASDEEDEQPKKPTKTTRGRGGKK
jgi:hypothetical protein